MFVQKIIKIHNKDALWNNLLFFFLDFSTQINSASYRRIQHKEKT